MTSLLETAIQNITNITTSSSSSSSLPAETSGSNQKAWAGFLGCLICVIGFGSSYVPVKKYITGDGFYYQMFLALGVWIVGLVVNIIQGFPHMEGIVLLGGAIWSIGNFLAVYTIQLLGMALGVPLYNVFLLIVGWSTGTFGLGIKKNKVSVPALNYVGLVVAIIAVILYIFVNSSQPDDADASKDSKKKNVKYIDDPEECSTPTPLKGNYERSEDGIEIEDLSRTPDSEAAKSSKSSPSSSNNEEEDEEKGKKKTHKSKKSHKSKGKKSHKSENDVDTGSKTPDSEANNSDETEVHKVKAKKHKGGKKHEHKGKDNDNSNDGDDGSSGSDNVEIIEVTKTPDVFKNSEKNLTSEKTDEELYNEEKALHSPLSDFIEGLSPMSKKVGGVIIAIITGVCFSVNFIPAQHLIDYDDNCSNDQLDYIFTHFTGFLLMTLVAFMVYNILMKNRPVVYPRLALPAFISGLLVGLAQVGWYIGNKNLSFNITFPINTSGPSVVASLWGIIVFREIRGVKQLTLVTIAIIVSILGVIFITLSKFL